MQSDPTDRVAAARGRSRRRFLALTAAGVAGLAGCSTETATPTDGGSDPGDGNDDGDGGSDGSDGSDGDTGGESTGDTTTPESVLGRPLESWSGYDPEWAPPTSSPLDATLRTEVLVENLEVPWDIAFAPDGDMFVTERVGRVLRFDGETVSTVAEPTEAIDAGSIEPGSDERPWWVEGGEGGTLGVAVHPTFPDPARIYVYYTYTTTEGGERTKYNKVAAFDVDSETPGEPVGTVVDGIPANSYHNGGRITFGPRNYLWVTCGDGGQPDDAQDPSSLAGKILRVTPAGDPAPGNPDLGDGADPRVFTYGHRNPQGIVWLPDGTPVNSEHGPTGRDEINRLVPGDNYSWNEVFEPEDYPGSGFHPPLFNTGATSFAPTGSLFYTGDSVPALRNRMVTGGLVSQQLIITTLTPEGRTLPPAENAYAQVTDDWSDQAYTATVHTTMKNELGRVRHVEQSPDGDVYVITSNRDGRAKGEFPRERDDVLVRLTQA
ncbi:PQQ-dependent sugar dehydrogenase [Halosimplex litoreum]|uniref:PQQ-dependent sugar dehydrogenase n=1 Tax=Halosimplex litoreum TaxID=1198301 RepID=A0A7T3KVT2_9EURY|nr:PQQ-dependent sugar dehydrogenase [Halosimplex litoreum]QPV63689.1 PQQ-dependent sugar dehydrogenase [Halosimplex litoreum]